MIKLEELQLAVDMSANILKAFLCNLKYPKIVFEDMLFENNFLDEKMEGKSLFSHRVVEEMVDVDEYFSLRVKLRINKALKYLNRNVELNDNYISSENVAIEWHNENLEKFKDLYMTLKIAREDYILYRND